MERIAILLATYNGGDRIHVLLDSILNQSYKNFTLYIHDDGSTDITLSVINSYQKGYPQIILLEDPFNHRGAKQSFIWMLSHVTADYYMFCDQDDLWLPNKINQSIHFIYNIEKENPDKPICIHTDLAVADANYNVISKSLWKLSKVKPRILENKDYIQDTKQRVYGNTAKIFLDLDILLMDLF